MSQHQPFDTIVKTYMSALSFVARARFIKSDFEGANRYKSIQFNGDSCSTHVEFKFLLVSGLKSNVIFAVEVGHEALK